MKQAVYGAFFQDGHAGGERWTEADERRLRSARPHVMTSSGPFFVGVVPLTGFAPLQGSECVWCKRPKVKTRDNGDRFCFGCGRVVQ